MSNNSYNDFKNGFKNDIKETGASLFLVGGLMLLGCVLFAVLMVAIKSTKIDLSTRFILGSGTILITALLIFSKSMRTRIAQIWLVGLIAIPILFLLFIVG
ncbi:hypothetical protein [Mucilaginibacter rubeus]|uniref:Uncharacterized protein n=1 Tax=Mucilaginibacter rubeus TaxID=2027860 RepID=A0A5C1HW57_9SPHI|nr:hypothetical protein [Mucilaginibacter rubeus]QEM10186.1 hypothetical protein DEO27_009165 [Mucilaginibacter rubeus]